MDKFKVSIIEYLGKVEGGVLVLLSIVYQDQYSEATFFYNKTDILLTISEELEEKIGDITKHKQYPQILRDILKQIVPYEQMYDSIDPVNFKRWVKGVLEIENDEAEEINPDEIKIKKDTE